MNIRHVEDKTIHRNIMLPIAFHGKENICRRVVTGLFLGSIVAALLVAGCSTRLISISSPRYQTMENQNYYLSITPLRINDRYCGFRLILKNKTHQPILVNWNNTFYIHDSRRQGSFLFDGVDFEDRHRSRPADRVRGWDIYIKTIWPSRLAEGDRDGWNQNPMEPGVHGVEVGLVVGGRPVSEKLEVRIVNREK